MSEQTSTHEHAACCSKKCTSLMWWATLLVAVIAVPAFGFIIASVIPTKGIGEIIVFMMACWFCTFLGMKLMQMPSMNQKLGGKKD
jgi:hypothetical protein